MSDNLFVNPLKLLSGLVIALVLMNSYSICFAVQDTSAFETEIQAIGKTIRQGKLPQAKTFVDQLWAEQKGKSGFVDAVRRVKDQYWTDGHYAEHFDLCERIVKAFPNDPLSIGIQVDQVTGYIKLKDKTKAAEKLNQFWVRYSTDERFVDYARQIKDQYWWDGYYAEHFALCERLIHAFPDNPLIISIYEDDITGYIRTQDVKTAAARLEAFWSQYGAKKGFTSHLRNIKDVYWSKGYTKEHDALCDKIVQTFPNDPVTLEILADRIARTIRDKDLLKASGDFEQFWTAHKADKGFVNAARRVKDQYWTDGHYAEHFDLCERIVKAFPDNPLSIGIQVDQVTGYIKLKDPVKASEKLEQFWIRYSLDDRFVDVARQIKDQYWTNGYYQEHFDLCERLVSQFSDNPLSLNIQVDQVTGYLKRNNVAKAKEELSQFWNQFIGQEGFVERAHSLGWDFMVYRNYDTALTIYQDLKKQFPDHERAPWFQRSIIQCCLAKGDQENLTSAVEELKTNYKECTDYVNQMEIAAGHLTDAEQYELAKGIYNSLLEQYPDSVRKIWFLQSRLRTDLGEKDVASADARVALIHQQFAQYKDYHDALSWAAYEYRSYGYYDKAISMYQDLYSKNPNDKVKLRCDEGVARAYLRLGDDAKVREQINRIYKNYTEDNPEGVGFYIYAIGEQYYWVGREVEKEGDAEAASAAYSKAIDIWQNHLRILPSQKGAECAYYSGVLFQRMKNYPQAITEYQRMLTGWPNHEFAWDAQYQIARCYDLMCEEGIKMEAEIKEKILAICQKMEACYPNSPATAGLITLREKYKPASSGQ